MTARDVIAEAIHRSDCGCQDRHADDEDREHADAVVAAVRGMSVEDQADLLNGAVERVMAPHWIDTGHPDVAALLGEGDGTVKDVAVLPSARAVGPWAALR